MREREEEGKRRGGYTKYEMKGTRYPVVSISILVVEAGLKRVYRIL